MIRINYTVFKRITSNLFVYWLDLGDGRYELFAGSNGDVLHTLAAGADLIDFQTISDPVNEITTHADGEALARASLERSSLDTVKQLFDLQSSTFYKGRASRTAATSSPVWTIERVLIDGSGNPLSIDTAGPNAIWDNRTTETYS